jgi:acyl-CoA reductase-like NAD-dependent aldehyde dehydrogenase
MDLPHIPCLRQGVPYVSLNQNDVTDYRNQKPLATVSQVNAGVVKRDLKKVGEARAALKKFTVEELIAISAKAGEEFLNGNLPLGNQGHMQSADEYVATLSSTSGLPYIMVRRNMTKIHHALTNMRTILTGLTRGLDLSIIDRGFGEQFGTRISFFPTAEALGLIMPSNSPAVNSLWLPSIALKIPVIIKPGREEPWTPYRLIQSFIAAGCPKEAFGFYPTDHEGSGAILQQCGRALIFGDKNTTDLYANNPGIQTHGPGFSKILIGEDEIENWQDHIDLIASSVADNGGRSCINASAVVVPRYGKEIADALAKVLGPLKPTTVDDEGARLSGFANPKMAEYINGTIEDDLKTPGGEDVTARYRDGDRKIESDGGTYLRPTIVYCENTNHPLYNREFLCPYASVVEVPQAEMLDRIGPSLVVSAITKDPDFTEDLLSSSLIERLNLGPITTMKVSWDQPHEGNMFEFLYKRRSIERA